jgi:hypothetical protein
MAQNPMHDGRSYLLLDDFLPTPPEEIIQDTREESDEHGPIAKCKSVQKQHAILPDTLGDLISPSKYF